MSYRNRVVAALLMAGAMVGAGALPAFATDLGRQHGCHGHYRYCDEGWWHHRGWRHDRDDFRHDGWRHDRDDFRHDGWRHDRGHWR